LACRTTSSAIDTPAPTTQLAPTLARSPTTVPAPMIARGPIDALDAICAVGSTIAEG